MKIILLLFLAINVLFANSLQIQTTQIVETSKKVAKIKIPNLKIGQSGVIVKNIGENSIIISQASIVKSTQDYSIIQFSDKEILLQDAIPTSNAKPQNGDDFILNHLYNTSLLIVPNLKAKTIVKELYPNQNFLNEDFFASHLKLIHTPLPKKETISNFAQSQQIGTIFIVVKNTLYILDSLTFKIIDTISIENNDNKTSVPFFTKIESIKQGFWDFGAEKIKNYNTYYLKLLEKK